jgi:hypothetical protein
MREEILLENLEDCAACKSGICPVTAQSTDGLSALQLFKTPDGPFKAMFQT